MYVILVLILFKLYEREEGRGKHLTPELLVDRLSRRNYNWIPALDHFLFPSYIPAPSLLFPLILLISFLTLTLHCDCFLHLLC